MASSSSLTTTHLPRLRDELAQWRAEQPTDSGFKSSLEDISNKLTNLNSLTVAPNKDIFVAFRTRPPVDEEANKKFALPQSAEESNSDTTNASNSGNATVQGSAFCYGITATSAEPGKMAAHVPGMKTGSGKTYTMEAIEHRVARDLFLVARAMGRRLLDAGQNFPIESSMDMTDSDFFEFSATWLDLLGKHAVDLLEPAGGLPTDAQGNVVRKDISIQENKAGDVRPGLISTQFKSSDELEKLIVTALSHRRTSATARNARSSRSHAVVTIRIKNKLLPYADEGELILVDLAGSERYEDSKLHDKQRMNESRENNKSLMNLKDCVRAKAKMANEDGFVHIPWRMNKLTMLLKPISDPEARRTPRTLVIAHVSPHIQDATRSFNTLAYAAPFRIAPPRPRGSAPYDAADPRTWDTAHTRAWLTDEFTQRTRTRTVANYKVRAKTAARRGQTLPPPGLGPAAKPAVDIARLCPESMTATHFARMYTVEFVQRCLEAASDSPEATPDILRNAAEDVMGTLTYLLLAAKTRTRNSIMKSRKKLALDSTYDAEIAEAAQSLGSSWDETLQAATVEAEQQHVGVYKTQAEVINQMMDRWKAGNANGERV
ncbi:predicted protein [Postia placenta Mad-698-R]|uniref:Kinesin-like protein n=1 Tax=Postia placenta MAD-698-R-SB12 TaxID=670580 RepID=A0A1X6MZC1_9APHY|nr:hypothetical protein POSPLADRAFT_1046988 [Postia placenta MAD-698-R-SB12]EED82646.1 predicted protein [Postia placenta Mad-698-R]OSX61705.1 hypothetical protein POSPLADRAFT_1046988 [Postia placenta MAD-698-R-SB12]